MSDLADRLTSAISRVLPSNRRLTIACGATLVALWLTLRSILLPKKRKSKEYVEDFSDISHALVGGKTFDEFDYIIVGGGTAGCVLAARLTENPNIRVLLLESGGSGRALPLSRIPSGFGQLLYSKHAFQFRTEPQIYTNGKKNFWPRARMLGGCSSINAQMAQYGAPQDFDEWADIIKDDSWSWNNFRKYFFKFENYAPDPDHPEVALEHNTKGPIRIGYFNYVSQSATAFVKSCMAIGIPFTPDFNGSKGTLGVNRIRTYVDEKRERVSSESAYLTNDVLARPNLSVAIHAHATRILFDTSGAEPRTVGVEYTKAPGEPVFRSTANKEVILCAGAIHTPHILMLSGVGPADQLKAHNIPVIQNLPGVGENLVDHPVVDVFYKDKLNASVLQYKLLRDGPLAMNFGESAAFVRSDDPVLFPPEQYPESLVDSTSSKQSPDLELFTTPFAYKEHGAEFFDIHTRALHCYLLRPLSKGNVFLKSANPFDLPGVNPNYLQDPNDLKKLIRGFRLTMRIGHVEPLASFLDHTFERADMDHQTHLKSDEELAEIVKQRIETVYHPTSTCMMAPREVGGVVDSKLRVYGISGLRVCDASFFPRIVSGHTAGACIASAEKLADELKREYI